MDARYGKTVFDEWAIISLAENKARVVAYRGPRNDDFLTNFVKDLGALRAELLDVNYGAGDFAFARLRLIGQVRLKMPIALANRMCGLIATLALNFDPGGTLGLHNAGGFATLRRK